MPLCALCGVNVPANGRQQHEKGRRHQSFRFHGVGNRDCKNVTVRNGMAKIVLRPHEIADSVVETVRGARALVCGGGARSGHTPLVAHTGVDSFDRVLAFFEPEILCEAMQRLYTPPHGPLGPLYVAAHFDRVVIGHVSSSGRGGASPQELAVVAQWLTSGFNDDPSPERSSACTLVVRLAQPAALDVALQSHNQLREMSTSAALCALSRALGCARRPLRVELHVGGALVERRLASLFSSSLTRAIGASTTLAEVAVHSWSGCWRAEDGGTWREAAREAWRARAVAFLLGSHARAGADSPVRMLPAAIALLILEMAGGPTLTSLVITDAPAPAAPAAVGGGDLAVVAMHVT